MAKLLALKEGLLVSLTVLTVLPLHPCGSPQKKGLPLEK